MFVEIKHKLNLLGWVWVDVDFKTSYFEIFVDENSSNSDLIAYVWETVFAINILMRLESDLKSSLLPLIHLPL